MYGCVQKERFFFFLRFKKKRTKVTKCPVVNSRVDKINNEMRVRFSTCTGLVAPYQAGLFPWHAESNWQQEWSRQQCRCIRDRWRKTCSVTCWCLATVLYQELFAASLQLKLHLQIFNCGLTTKSEMCKLTGCCQTQLSILHLLICFFLVFTHCQFTGTQKYLIKGKRPMKVSSVRKPWTQGRVETSASRGRNLTRFSDLLQSFTWGHLRSRGKQEDWTRLRPWRTGLMLPLEV